MVYSQVGHVVLAGSGSGSVGRHLRSTMGALTLSQAMLRLSVFVFLPDPRGGLTATSPSSAGGCDVSLGWRATRQSSVQSKHIGRGGRLPADVPPCSMSPIGPSTPCRTSVDRR